MPTVAALPYDLSPEGTEGKQGFVHPVAIEGHVEMAGIDFHYRSISRGLIDTRDVIYFLSIILLFFSITNRNLLKR